MKKANFILAIAVVSTLTFFSSCLTYGPAYMHQKVSYIERPFGEETASQVYVTGQYGGDATYQPGETNRNGQIGVHWGFNSSFYQITTGAFGGYGQYKAFDGQNYDYSNFGLKLHQTLKFMANEKTEIQIFGVGNSISSEKGRYEELRYRRSRATLDSIGGSDVSFDHIYVTTGLRYKVDNSLLLGFQYGYGTDGFIFLTPNASHSLTLSGNFGRTTLTLNMGISEKVTSSINPNKQPTFSVGITHSLTKNGLKM